jgi:hypothetical protein
VSNGYLGYHRLVRVDAGLGDTLPQAGNLANLLEKNDLAWLVTIDTKASRIITTVLLTS